MNKKITILEFIVLTYFIIRASFTGISSMLLINSAEENAWISLILGFIIGFIPIMLYFGIMNYEPNLNIFEKNIKLFKKLGYLINAILIIITCLFCTVMFYNLTNFIYSQFLNKTPPIFIALLFSLAMIYSISKGLYSITKSFVIVFFMCFSLYLISLLGILPQFEFDNLKPLFKNNFISIIKGALYYVGYNILPIFFLTAIPKNKIENNDKINKYTKLIYILTFIAELLVVILLIGTLGIKLVTLYQYPEFHILKKISYFSFVDRMESTLALQWIMNFYCFITFGIYFIITGLKSFKIRKYTSFLIPIFIMIFQNYIFSGNTEGNIFITNIFIFCVYFGLLLIPLIIAIKKRCKASFH